MGCSHHTRLRVGECHVENRGRFLFKNKRFKNPRSPLAIQTDPLPFRERNTAKNSHPGGLDLKSEARGRYVPGLPCQVAEEAQGTEAVRGFNKHLPYLV